MAYPYRTAGVCHPEKGLAGASGGALRRTAKYGGGFVAVNRFLRHAPF